MQGYRNASSWPWKWRGCSSAERRQPTAPHPGGRAALSAACAVCRFPSTFYFLMAQSVLFPGWNWAEFAATAPLSAGRALCRLPQCLCPYPSISPQAGAGTAWAVCSQSTRSSPKETRSSCSSAKEKPLLPGLARGKRFPLPGTALGRWQHPQGMARRSRAGCLMLRGLGCPHKLTLSCTQRSSGSCLMFLEAPAHADPCPELLPGTSDHFAQAKPGPTGMCCFRRALHQQGSSLPRLAQPTSREKAGNNFSGAPQSSQERSRKQQSPAWGTSALRDPSVAGQPTFTQHLHAACAQHQAPCALRSGHEVISVPFKRCFPALHQPG